MIIKIINKGFVYDFYLTRWFEWLLIIRPKQAWDRCEIFRFRRELHYQLPPIREIFYDYQLNLMSFVKTHPRHTSEIQCPVLCSRILHRHTYSVSRHNVSTPVFHNRRQAPYCFFIWKKVWVVLWQNEWSPKNIRSKLSPSSLSLIHIWRCRRSTLCRSRWSPYH